MQALDDEAPFGVDYVKADYKQIQMRILANLSQDPDLIAAFRDGRDVHWLTVEMCDIQGASDKEKRDKAKAVNYGILFQITADGLSRELGTDMKTAHAYIKAFWAKYLVARQYMDNFTEELKKEKTGRKSYELVPRSDTTFRRRIRTHSTT